MSRLTQTINSKFKNLVTAGCSFSTVDHNSEHSLTWPEYLRDRMGIDNLYSLAQPGSGNRQITASTMWFLEENQLDCEDTLIVIMFSGNDRDDEIADISKLTQPSYRYNNSVAGAITGGQTLVSIGNIKSDITYKEVITKLKSHNSRAVENYLHIISLYNYLENNNYQTVYTKFLDTQEPSRSKDFDIKEYLTDAFADKIDTIIDPKLTNIYSWCLKKSLLSDDDFHPSPQGYLSWVDSALLPYITSKFNL